MREYKQFETYITSAVKRADKTLYKNTTNSISFNYSYNNRKVLKEVQDLLLYNYNQPHKEKVLINVYKVVLNKYMKLKQEYCKLSSSTQSLKLGELETYSNILHELIRYRNILDKQ